MTCSDNLENFKPLMLLLTVSLLRDTVQLIVPPNYSMYSYLVAVTITFSDDKFKFSYHFRVVKDAITAIKRPQLLC